MMVPVDGIYKEIMMNGDLRSKAMTPTPTPTNDTVVSAGAGRVTKSHSEAERRRRQRINAHLATFRTLVPNTKKMDKASLLMEVVRKVRELRKVALSSPNTRNGILPGEADEVRMEQIMSSTEEYSGQVLRVSFCCEDRPGLMGEVQQAIKSVHARAVRAEMATVGGRTKGVVILEGEVEGKERSMLQSSLKAVVEKNNSPFGMNSRLRVSARSMGIS